MEDVVITKESTTDGSSETAGREANNVLTDDDATATTTADYGAEVDAVEKVIKKKEAVFVNENGVEEEAMVSRRMSAISDRSNRHTSLRTEALIQAAAQAVVATIELQDGGVHHVKNEHRPIITARALSNGGHERRQHHANADAAVASTSKHGDAKYVEQDAHQEHDNDCEDYDDKEKSDNAFVDGHRYKFNADKVFSDYSQRSSLGSVAMSSHGDDNGTARKLAMALAASVPSSSLMPPRSRLPPGMPQSKPRLSTVLGVSDFSHIVSQYEHSRHSFEMSSIRGKSCEPESHDEVGERYSEEDYLYHHEHNENGDDNDDANIRSDDRDHYSNHMNVGTNNFVNYVPFAARGPARPVFRSPSSVRTFQKSSPSPSVISNSNLPRPLTRRRTGDGGSMSGGSDGFSPASASYHQRYSSVSKPSTPGRFKNVESSPRPTPPVQQQEKAPLVLLHVTLMPSRWAWADVMQGLGDREAAAIVATAARGDHKATATLGGGGDCELSTKANKGTEVDAVAAAEPSAGVYRLVAAWHQLQDYTRADTLAERGLLLPHPHDDYEVLEERLLEALELPVRRRARILECGHYLGPANMADDDTDDVDGDDIKTNSTELGETADRVKSTATCIDGGGPTGFKGRHWCKTCRNEIKLGSLGPQRVFRVKVYASNGLITAGAWEACWRQMERVDVEIEPIVSDAGLLKELTQLRAVLQVEEELRQMADEDEEHILDEIEGDDDNNDFEGEGMDKKEIDQNVAYVHTVASPRLMLSTIGRTKHRQLSESLVRARIESPADGSTSGAGQEAKVLQSSLRQLPGGAGTLENDDEEVQRRRHDAEERLREIYGHTAPPTITAGLEGSGNALSDGQERSAFRLGTGVRRYDGGDDDLADHTHKHEPPFPPSFPISEVLAWRNFPRQRQAQQQQHRDRQGKQLPTISQGAQCSSRLPWDSRADTDVAPPIWNLSPLAPAPAPPYQSASLGELLLAAGNVVLRDHRHVAVMIISAVVILLMTLRPSSPVVPGVDVGVPKVAMALQASIPSAMSGASGGGVPASDQRESPMAVVLANAADVNVDANRKATTELKTGPKDVASISVALDVTATTQTKMEAKTEVELAVETFAEKNTVKVCETVMENETVTATATLKASTTCLGEGATVNEDPKAVIVDAEVTAMGSVEAGEAVMDTSAGTKMLVTA